MTSTDSVAFCPLCGERVTAGDRAVCCSNCGALHHQACWARSGKCGVFRCTGRPVPFLFPVNAPSDDPIEVVLHGSTNHTTVGKICPYCQTPIQTGTDIICCPECEMPHHVECWRDNGGCTTFGCTGNGEVRSGVRMSSNDSWGDGGRIVIDNESLNAPWFPPSRGRQAASDSVARAAKILVAAVVMIVIFASIWSASDHHEYGYDSPYGNSAESSTGSSGVTPPVKWSRQAAGLLPHGEPVLVGNRLFITCDGRLLAVDWSNGETRWSYDAGSHVDEAPVAERGGVYVTYDHILTAVDAKTGEFVWRFGKNLYIDAGPVYAEGAAYCCLNGKLAAFDPRSGTHKWSLPLVAESWPNAKYSVEVHGDVVLAKYSGQAGPYTLVAADSRTGRKLWQFSDVCCDVVGNGVIYLGQISGTARAILMKTGHEKWSFESSHRYWFEPGLSSGGVMFATNRRLHYLSRKTGKERWSFDFGEMPSGDDLRPAPFVAGGQVCVSNGYHLYGLSLEDGRQLWRHVPSTRIGAEYWPTFIGYKSGAIYVAEPNGYLAGIDASSGNTIWYEGEGGAITSHFFTEDGRLFIGTENGVMSQLKVSGKS